MAVSAADVLAKAQAVIDKQAARGLSIGTAEQQKAEYDAAHAQAVADDNDYSAAFDDFVNTAHDFNKDVVTIP